MILLFNDHWLRWHYPSWLTGKLGDFAWLIFAPFIAALLFSWLIPRRLKQHEMMVGVISFAFIGLWFILAKINPLVHHITVTTLENIIGWQTTLRMDVTDLLTLPGLFVGYWIWQHGKNTLTLPRRAAVRIVFTLGTMATLATSVPSADSGLTCVVQLNQNLIVFGGISAYSSRDGGLNWQPVKTIDAQVQSVTRENCLEHSIKPSFMLVDSSNKNIQYRFQRAQSIERSVDGGQTWNVDIDLSELSQDVRQYYQHQKTDQIGIAINASPGPFDAIIDKVTGNLVVAMGQDGMLVRTPNGQWTWIEIGQYHRVEIYRFDRIFDLLKGELILSGILMLLVLTTYLQPHRPRFATIVLASGWILWLFGAWVPVPKSDDSPGLNIGFFTYYSNTLAAVIVFLLIVGAVAHILDQKISAKQVIETVLLALGSGALFLFPYLLWSQGTIPSYSTASIFALLLGLSAAFGTGQYLKRRYPVINPEKALET
ncbi:MAG: hypothetical protein ABI690_00445 [Chloroflexota bacterium]